MRKKLLIGLLCQLFLSSILHAQCTMGSNITNCNATTFAISTIQTFKPTCSGVVSTVVCPNVSFVSDDLRFSGFFVAARIRTQAGLLLGSSTPTDQYYPGATVTFNLLCSNVYLTAGTTYQLEFYETTGTTQLILFCKTSTSIYADGNVIEDGAVRPNADLTRWQVNVAVEPPLPVTNATQTQNVSTCNRFATTASELIAFVQPGTTNGIANNVTLKVFLENFQPADYVKRHYEITPAANAATATGRVTLYFTQAEFDAYNVINASKLPANANDAIGKANLKIEKRAGTSNNGTGLPASYTGTISTIDPADADIVYNTTAGRWEVSFNVTGFSGFFVKSTAFVLPLKWLNVNGALSTKKQAVITWKVAEQDAATYRIERSANGTNFTTAGVKASIGNGKNNYSFTDDPIVSGIMYYRILQTDFDGRSNYSAVIKINVSQVSEQIYPTVFTGGFTVNAKVATRARLIDAQGRLVREVNLFAGNNYILAGELAKGIYIIVFENGLQQRIIKQ